MDKEVNKAIENMDGDIKEVHDIVQMGSVVVINQDRYALSEIMLVVSKQEVFIVAKYVFAKEKQFLCALDCFAKKPIPLSKRQVEQYIELRRLHEERFAHKSIHERELLTNINASLIGLVALGKDVICLLGEEKNFHSVEQNLMINNMTYEVSDFSILVTVSGDSLVVSLADEVFLTGLHKDGLYNDIYCTWNIGEQKYIYRGNIVRAKKGKDSYVCYIQPYSMEVLQSKNISETKFENITSPFSVIDFVINYSDSDVKGIVYPNSDKRPIQNYIVIGILENVEIDIEDCVLGNVRVGGDIEVPDKFRELLSRYQDKKYTLVWVDLKIDSLYNALNMGKQLLQCAADFLAFAAKSDTYDEWYGTVTNEKGYWDIRNHSPKIRLGNIFYVENCINGESVTLNEESWTDPHFLRMQEDTEYLFEYEWVEKLFLALEKENPKVMRLQHAIKWIIQGWNTEDKYDRVIYCSMALEFIVNGEKGSNIFEEYAEKCEKKVIAKAEKKQLINQIVDKIELDEIDGMPLEMVAGLNSSIQKMVRSKLSESSFGTKLSKLISRLHIPVNCDEEELLNRARKIRNQLVHGIEMNSITTLEVKKLCGITSRILMYKLQNELEKSE